MRANLESPSHATLDIHVRPLASVPGTDSRALASLLKTIFSPSLLLSHHPRTLVRVVGQALCGSDSGSGTGTVGRGWNAVLTASLINACSAAFINAGSLPMRGTVCAVSVGRLAQDNGKDYDLILDPSETELPQLAGGGCFAFMFSSTLARGSSPSEADIPNAALLWRNYAALDGSFDEHELARAQELALDGAQEVWRKLKASISGELSAHRERRDEKATHPKIVAAESDVDDEKMEI